MFASRQIDNTIKGKGINLLIFSFLAVGVKYIQEQTPRNQGKSHADNPSRAKVYLAKTTPTCPIKGGSPEGGCV